MKSKSMFMPKKALIFALFSASIIASPLLFNSDRASAQNFLDNVRSSSASNCGNLGSQCTDCARNLARDIIRQNNITNQRMQKAIYNAAISGCN